MRFNKLFPINLLLKTFKWFPCNYQTEQAERGPSCVLSIDIPSYSNQLNKIDKKALKGAKVLEVLSYSSRQVQSYSYQSHDCKVLNDRRFI